MLYGHSTGTSSHNQFPRAEGRSQGGVREKKMEQDQECLKLGSRGRGGKKKKLVWSDTLRGVVYLMRCAWAAVHMQVASV